MQLKQAGLALQVVIVVLLAVIALELAQQPRPVDTSPAIYNVSSELNKANGYLERICINTLPSNVPPGLACPAGNP